MSIDCDSEFVSLLTEHQHLLGDYMFSLMPNHPDIRDVLQEVNIWLWENRGSFELGTNFKAWAFQVARYRILKEKRRLRRHNWLVLDGDITEMLSGGDDQTPAQLEDRREALRHCLEKLHPDERSLLRARYASETNLERYAADSGQRPGTLRVALHRLRSALRRCIEQRMASEPM